VSPYLSLGLIGWKIVHERKSVWPKDCYYNSECERAFVAVVKIIGIVNVMICHDYHSTHWQLSAKNFSQLMHTSWITCLLDSLQAKCSWILHSPRVFNSRRLGVNKPKNFILCAQILRHGRHDIQIKLPLIMLISL